MLHEMLSKVATQYTYERAKPFAGSEFGNFVRHDLAIEARKQLIFLPYDLTVKASVGAGVWASVPWLGFFDPLITVSATSGFYVVYLINPQTEEIFLSLNQGTTAVFNEFGQRRGIEVLRRRAEDMRQRIDRFSTLFDVSPINLGSEASLPAGYMAGHAFGCKYQARKIDETSFSDDLTKMLSAYEALIDYGGLTPSDVMQEEAGTSDIKETRKYVLSKRIERTSNVRKKVLERRQPICEACGIDPVVHLSYQGPLENVPLDIHHCKPIFQLAEGESRRYKIPEDFFVLCPTCHRMIHKLDDPSNLTGLRSKISFNLEMKKTD